jgi:hypothetical protein
VAFEVAIGEGCTEKIEVALVVKSSTKLSTGSGLEYAWRRVIDARGRTMAILDTEGIEHLLRQGRESYAGWLDTVVNHYRAMEAKREHAAGPEERRRAYRRYGARFEVDGEGTLTLKLDLALDEGVLNLTSTRS